ncbi:polyADP-ribose glycohydrolase [Fadolivirus algeromassiliense]|jgi:poly(ADP-ribose) glycohydrolase|uniref:poly(ADP-ribose) glycohydrolase n=1 Tax=Fadolivirus FV1/VV64 TaxID=3070911 RepID=A0A7D3UQZ1_9VIRU|nr:polyADP-ribose glycohydrolase [Fadolivirus algeromassiliense]QKF94848.1 polyADP-ribose glycohydrolase [Fadolivirus FV1/VV64]
MSGKLLFYNGDIRKQKLEMKVTNHDELLILLNRFSRMKRISTLLNTIDRYNEYFKTNFYEVLLPNIIKWSMELEVDELPLLQKGNQSSFSFSAREARYWLANAFILNVDRVQKENYGELVFYELYNGSITGAEKMLCILCYFHQAMELDVDRLISFDRYVITEDPSTVFDSNKKINPKNIIIHVDNMESIKANAFVNFANEQLSYGITNSCTQEEVLNACCPETYLALLFIESMDDNEVIIIRGARRYSTYLGYMNNFKWNGIYTDTIFQDQIGLDACTRYHFSTGNVNRDLMKAYMGFKMSSASPISISTGHWGCGAFGGNMIHKFLQQVLAASVIPNVKLYYSTFGSNETACKFSEILDYIVLNNITIGQLYENLSTGKKLGF